MNWFSYRISLYKLQRERNKERKTLFKLIEETKKKDGQKIANEMYQTESVNLNIIDGELIYLKTRYLISIAEKMSLPTPRLNEKDGMWEESHYTNKWQLTNKGITEIRKLIRQERKEKLELVSHWATILIGIIGAITGLIAVIMR